MIQSFFRAYRHLGSPTWLYVLKQPLTQVDAMHVSKFSIKLAIRAEVPAGQLNEFSLEFSHLQGRKGVALKDIRLGGQLGWHLEFPRSS